MIKHSASHLDHSLTQRGAGQGPRWPASWPGAAHVSQEHGTGELPASGLHDDTCKWLCEVRVGTPCVAHHSCSTCEFLTGTGYVDRLPCRAGTK